MFTCRQTAEEYTRNSHKVKFRLRSASCSHARKTHGRLSAPLACTAPMTGRPRSSFQGPVRLPGGQLVDVTAAIFGPNDDFVCSDELSSGPGLIVFTRHWAEQRVVGCIKHLINAKKTERCAGISSDPVLVRGNQVWTQLNVSLFILVLRSGVGKGGGIRSAVSVLIGSNLVNNIGATSHSIHCFGVHFLQVGP